MINRLTSTYVIAVVLVCVNFAAGQEKIKLPQVRKTMVSDEEIERVLSLGMNVSHEDFEEFAAKHAAVFEEQERRNDTVHSIPERDHELLKKNLTENPEYVKKIFTEKPLLHTAAYYGNLDACKILLNAGADVKQLSNSGQSVLAHTKLEPGLIKFLLEVGADPNNRNVYGVFTMYESVQEETRLEIVKLFVKHGLDVNRVYIMMGDPNALSTVLDHMGTSFPKIRTFLINKGAKHAHELDKPGAYDDANQFLSYEELENLRRRMREKATGSDKSE